MLRTIIEQKHCLFADSAADWKDAVRLSCKTLEADGTVDPEYAEQIISCIEKYGPYIILTPGIAMPHSQEGAVGVHKTAVAFTKLKTPVSFAEGDPNKSASVFFTLASCDHNEHMANIQKLATILLNPSLAAALQTVRSEEDLLALQKQYLDK